MFIDPKDEYNIVNKIAKESDTQSELLATSSLSKFKDSSKGNSLLLWLRLFTINLSIHYPKWSPILPCCSTTMYQYAIKVNSRQNYFIVYHVSIKIYILITNLEEESI